MRQEGQSSRCMCSTVSYTKNIIRDGGSTALYDAFTVGTVDTVYTVDTVDTVDMV